MSTAHPVPTPEDIEAIARDAVAHAHTVARRLLGLPVRGAVRARIDRELARRGYAVGTDPSAGAPRA